MTIDMPKLISLIQEEVNAQKGYNYRCWSCDKLVFYAPAPKAYVQGHIYSSLGLREYHISETCEFCFEEMALE